MVHSQESSSILFSSFLQAAQTAAKHAQHINHHTNFDSESTSVLWKDLEREHTLLRDAIQELGWKALQAYQADVFSNTHTDVSHTDASHSQHQTPSQEKQQEPITTESISKTLFSEDLQPTERPSLSPSSLLSSGIESPPEHVGTEFDDEEEITEERLLALSTTMLQTNSSPSPTKPTTTTEPLTIRQAWKKYGVLMTGVEKKSDLSEHYSLLNSMFNKDCFVLWKKLDGNVLTNMYRFFAFKIIYLQSKPRNKRPNNALGDGAYTHMLKQLKKEGPIARKIIKNIEQSPYSVLPQMKQAWTKVNESIVHQSTRPAKPPIQFNPERALDVLRDLVHNNDPEAIVDQLNVMLYNKMSISDPRLLAILHEHVDSLQGSHLKQLRANIRRHRRQEEIEVSPPEEWAHAEYFNNKRIFILGGDKGSIIKDNCKDLIPTANVEWFHIPPENGLRRLDSVIDTINYGRVDCILIIQNFVSHTISSRIVQAAKYAPNKPSFGLAPRGYGKGSLRKALMDCIKN